MLRIAAFIQHQIEGKGLNTEDLRISRVQLISCLIARNRFKRNIWGLKIYVIGVILLLVLYCGVPLYWEKV